MTGSPGPGTFRTKIDGLRGSLSMTWTVATTRPLPLITSAVTSAFWNGPGTVAPRHGPFQKLQSWRIGPIVQVLPS